MIKCNERLTFLPIFSIRIIRIMNCFIFLNQAFASNLYLLFNMFLRLENGHSNVLLSFMCIVTVFLGENFFHCTYLKKLIFTNTILFLLKTQILSWSNLQSSTANEMHHSIRNFTPELGIHIFLHSSFSLPFMQSHLAMLEKQVNFFI